MGGVCGVGVLVGYLVCIELRPFRVLGVNPKLNISNGTVKVGLDTATSALSSVSIFETTFAGLLPRLIFEAQEWKLTRHTSLLERHGS